MQFLVMVSCAAPSAAQTPTLDEGEAECEIIRMLHSEGVVSHTRPLVRERASNFR